MNRVTRVLNDIYWGFRKTTRVVNRVPTGDFGAWNRDVKGASAYAEASARQGAGSAGGLTTDRE